MENTPRCVECGQEVARGVQIRLRELSSCDEKYQKMIQDNLRWFSEGRLTYDSMRSNVKLDLKLWHSDRNGIKNGAR